MTTILRRVEIYSAKYTDDQAYAPTVIMRENADGTHDFLVTTCVGNDDDGVITENLGDALRALRNQCVAASRGAEEYADLFGVDRAAAQHEAAFWSGHAREVMEALMRLLNLTTSSTPTRSPV